MLLSVWLPVWLCIGSLDKVPMLALFTENWMLSMPAADSKLLPLFHTLAVILLPRIHQDAKLLHLVTSIHGRQAAGGSCQFFPQHSAGWWCVSKTWPPSLRTGLHLWGMRGVAGSHVWYRQSFCSLWPSDFQELKYSCQAWSLGIWVCVSSLQLGDTMASVGSGLTRACSMRRQNRMALPTSLRLWNTSVFSSAYSMMSFSWWWKNSRIPDSHKGKVSGTWTLFNHVCGLCQLGHSPRLSNPLNTSLRVGFHAKVNIRQSSGGWHKISGAK